MPIINNKEVVFCEEVILPREALIRRLSLILFLLVGVPLFRWRMLRNPPRSSAKTDLRFFHTHTGERFLLILKLYLLIFIALIFDSSVDGGMPSKSATRRGQIHRLTVLRNKGCSIRIALIAIGGFDRSARRHDMSSGRGFGGRMERVDRLIGRIVNLK